ncbi:MULTISPECIES: hypothetical protein [unclassified Microcystis]|uniref:hypothetical protein n=1 Tax=unclassified Microcystis TaxID=2643300 RepID=UPI00259046E8|nr:MULTISPECIES: hypothetical protein [unclassified Microcystis]
MSKSNSKKEIFSLRQEFHQALEKWDFIQEISLSQDACIEIQETNKSELKKVVINHLQLSSKNDKNRFFVTWYGSIGGHKLTKSLSGKRLN